MLVRLCMQNDETFPIIIAKILAKLVVEGKGTISSKGLFPFLIFSHDESEASHENVYIDLINKQLMDYVYPYYFRC